MRADCVDPEGVVQCGCTDTCVERAAGDWLTRLDQLPTDEAKRAAIHQLAEKLLPKKPVQESLRYTDGQRKPV